MERCAKPVQELEVCICDRAGTGGTTETQASGSADTSKGMASGTGDAMAIGPDAKAAAGAAAKTGPEGSQAAGGGVATAGKDKSDALASAKNWPQDSPCTSGC